MGRGFEEAPRRVLRARATGEHPPYVRIWPPRPRPSQVAGRIASGAGILSMVVVCVSQSTLCSPHSTHTRLPISHQVSPRKRARSRSLSASMTRNWGEREPLRHPELDDGAADLFADKRVQRARIRRDRHAARDGPRAARRPRGAAALEHHGRARSLVPPASYSRSSHSLLSLSLLCALEKHTRRERQSRTPPRSRRDDAQHRRRVEPVLCCVCVQSRCLFSTAAVR